jgi:putative nucleotidyltransferase with HDIG domain
MPTSARPAGATVSTLPPLLARFIVLVTCVGLVIIAHSLWMLPAVPHAVGWILFGVLGIIAAWFPLKVPGAVYMSISDTFFITSALLFGPAPATVTIAVDSLIISVRRRNSIHQLVFNVTSSAIALWCGVQAYYVLSGQPPLAGSVLLSGSTIAPLMVLAAIYFGLNTGMTASAVALSKSISPFRVWRQHFAIMGLNYFAAASASFFLIVLARSLGVGALVAVVPLLCICYLAMRSWLGRVEDAQRHIDKVNQLYMSTIGAFSTAIEAKDGVTSDHVNRVQAYALGLARALGVTDAAELQALEAASLLHDTGKLAVPEHVLNKPGRLTPAEMETMQAHVDVGADILSSIDFPYPVVPIVRAHHENWDGSGYPRGLRGDEIPLGARILSVVDCFDALTSDRPYRAAMSQDDAIAIIVARRGTMYDPRVVDTFMRVYRDIVPTLDQRPALQSAVKRIRRVHQPAPVRHALTGAREIPVADSSDELLAFVSLARLAAHTGTIRDVGVMAGGYLRPLAPGATFTLMTVDTMRGVLVVDHAVGPAASRLQGLTIDVGHRVSGWVAANWQPMVNAEAQLDLDDQAEDLRYVLSLPLVAENRLTGVLTVYSTEMFGDLQSRRVEMITPHLAGALASVDNVSAHKPDAIAAPKSSRDLRVVSRR